MNPIASDRKLDQRTEAADLRMELATRRTEALSMCDRLDRPLQLLEEIAEQLGPGPMVLVQECQYQVGRFRAQWA